MNPEFKRQLVRKLLWLSEWMIAETDSTSPYHWSRHMKFIDGRVDAILAHLQKRKNRKPAETLATELWIDPWLYRQHNFANLVESDPFLPKILRKKIANFYRLRVVDMSLAYTKVMTRLAQGEIHEAGPKSADKMINCWRQLNDAYHAKGWGWESSHKRIIGFRRAIEHYLIKLK